VVPFGGSKTPPIIISVPFAPRGHLQKAAYQQVIPIDLFQTVSLGERRPFAVETMMTCFCVLLLLDVVVNDEKDSVVLVTCMPSPEGTPTDEKIRSASTPLSTIPWRHPILDHGIGRQGIAS